MILTGETAGLGEKPDGTVPLCTPQISHGRNVLGSNLELRGRKSGADRLSCDIIKGSRIRDSNCVKCRTEMRQTDRQTLCSRPLLMLVCSQSRQTTKLHSMYIYDAMAVLELTSGSGIITKLEMHFNIILLGLPDEHSVTVTVTSGL